jgi:hypothetical protein
MYPASRRGLHRCAPCFWSARRAAAKRTLRKQLHGYERADYAGAEYRSRTNADVCPIDAADLHLAACGGDGLAAASTAGHPRPAALLAAQTGHLAWMLRRRAA